MINFAKFRRRFLPSKTLGLYVAKLYIVRFLGLLLGLVAVLQLLDLLAVSDAIMAADGATRASVLKYVGLRLPQLISQFIPFSALLATLLTLATLNQHSEVIVMKAAGLSAHRILFPLGLPCAFIAFLHFGFNESVLIDANAELNYWEENGYALNLPPAPDVTERVSVIDNGTMILAASAGRNGNVVILDTVAIYEQGPSGQVESLTRASFATYVDGRWRLFEVRQFDPITKDYVTLDNQDWDLALGPERFLNATVNPDYIGVSALKTAIDRRKAEGRNVDALTAGFYQKFSGVMATLLMPLLGAVAGFGVHRAGSLLIRVVFGMALGFTFFVADNFMLAMGQFGVAPPLLAAGAPFLLFMTLGFAVLFFTEE